MRSAFITDGPCFYSMTGRWVGCVAMAWERIAGIIEASSACRLVCSVHITIFSFQRPEGSLSFIHLAYTGPRPGLRVGWHSGDGHGLGRHMETGRGSGTMRGRVVLGVYRATQTAA